MTSVLFLQLWSFFTVQFSNLYIPTLYFIVYSFTLYFIARFTCFMAPNNKYIIGGITLKVQGFPAWLSLRTRFLAVAEIIIQKIVYLLHFFCANEQWGCYAWNQFLLLLNYQFTILLSQFIPPLIKIFCGISIHSILWFK